MPSQIFLARDLTLHIDTVKHFASVFPLVLILAVEYLFLDFPTSKRKIYLSFYFLVIFGRICLLTTYFWRLKFSFLPFILVLVPLNYNPTGLTFYKMEGCNCF